MTKQNQRTALGNVPTPDPESAVVTSECTRMADLLAATEQSKDWDGPIRTDDGWREALNDGDGFRHEYDENIAKGAWEFRLLRPGLSIAVVDYTVVHPTPRQHSPGENIVMSAVLSGASHMQNSGGFEGDLERGYCTVYGLHDEDFETMYRPDSPLKWVSIFIDRHNFSEITGLSTEGLPDDLRQYCCDGTAVLPPRNVPLTSAALVAASDIFDCSLTGVFRPAYLTAKAIELSCHILFYYSHSADMDQPASHFTQADFQRLKTARSLLEKNLESPISIEDLSAASGFTRQRLQLGFRLLFGDTVARVRDKYRMQHALELVRSTDLSILEIALATGYEHHASFTRAFKTEYGISPMKMRHAVGQYDSLAPPPNTE